MLVWCEKGVHGALLVRGVVPIHVLAICGSLRKASFNRGALNAVAAITSPEFSVTVRSLDDLPMFSQDVVDASGRPPAVVAFRDAIAAADAVLIATPEYDHSISGVLKNAIDWAHGKDTPLMGKAVAILSASSSPLGGSRAQYDLREILASLSAAVLPMPEMFIGGAAGKFDASGALTDEATREALAAFMTAFGEWVRRMRGAEAP